MELTDRERAAVTDILNPEDIWHHDALRQDAAAAAHSLDDSDNPLNWSSLRISEAAARE